MAQAQFIFNRLEYYRQLRPSDVVPQGCEICGATTNPHHFCTLSHEVVGTYQHGVGVGACSRSKDVVRALHVGHPVADCLRGRILQSRSSRVNRAHLLQESMPGALLITCLGST